MPLSGRTKPDLCAGKRNREGWAPWNCRSSHIHRRYASQSAGKARVMMPDIRQKRCKPRRYPSSPDEEGRVSWFPQLPWYVNPFAMEVTLGSDGRDTRFCPGRHFPRNHAITATLARVFHEIPPAMTSPLGGSSFLPRDSIAGSSRKIPGAFGRDRVVSNPRRTFIYGGESWHSADSGGNPENPWRRGRSRRALADCRHRSGRERVGGERGQLDHES